MKKLLAMLFLIGAFACNNPEDNATNPGKDSTQYKEENTLNTPPGATTPDTSGGATTDSSHADTSGTAGKY